MMHTCDVLIIGGGPAGSTCAWALRHASLDVVVMDKRTFPRDKVCAGWVTPAVVRSLALDTDDYARSRTFQPITGFRVSRMSSPAVESRYDEPVSYGIRRCEFDDYLLRRCGARTQLGQGVSSIERRDGRWIVNDQIAAPLLIGAGGHFCPVARHLGAKSAGSEVVVAAQEIEFELSPQQRMRCPIRPEVPELYFCDDLLGYGWCFRKGDHLNIGLGRESNVRIGQHVAQFLELLKREGRVPPDTPERFHGHAYILYGHTQRRIIDDGVLLIGDAAGLAYPQSGEGIRTAVESALLAAQTIEAARGDFTCDRLEPYARRVTERFGHPGKPLASAEAPSAIKRFVAHRLLATRWFTRHVVMDRWFLHRQQPPLIGPLTAHSA